MSKEEYVAKLDALQKEMADLKFEYIKSNSKIPNGTKVKVHYKHYGANYPTGYDEYGIVLGYDICFDDVRPIVAKMKKDGTPHATARLYVGSASNVEICD
jgi:hypothetical protein